MASPYGGAPIRDMMLSTRLLPLRTHTTRTVTTNVFLRMSLGKVEDLLGADTRVSRTSSPVHQPHEPLLSVPNNTLDDVLRLRQKVDRKDMSARENLRSESHVNLYVCVSQSSVNVRTAKPKVDAKDGSLSFSQMS